MKKEERLKLMIISELDSYQENYFPEALNIYFSKARESLETLDFSTIEFCIEKICDFYDAYNNQSHKGLVSLLTELHTYNIETNDDKKERESLYKFWVSFKEWYNKQKEELSTIFVNECRFGFYTDEINRTGWQCTNIKCNEESLYKIEYGEEFAEPNENTITLKFIKNYIELIYSKFINYGKEGKYIFAIQVNGAFSRLELPYKLDKGKIKKQGYKTSLLQDKILNYEQFERKIEFSEEMILHKDLMDKHAALEYVADAFCYFYSLFKKEDDSKIELEDAKVNSKIASIVYTDLNKKQYTLFKSEIAEIKKIINDDYDIRHNEYYRRSDKGKREILSDITIIEYLYNRIYSLLFVLRLKYKKPKKILYKIDIDFPF